jgi:hypothetical protein
VPVTFHPESAVHSIQVQAPILAVVAFQIDGQWQCMSDAGDPITAIMEPHSRRTFPFWFLSQSLSNAAPRVPRAVLNTWAFLPPAIEINNGYSSIRTSGPNAVRCEGDDDLMLYAHLPLRIGTGIGGIQACGRAR